MIKVVSEEERERRLKLAVGCATRHVAAKRLRDGQRTTREAEIIALAAVGISDEEAALRLGIDPTTPGTYWKRALARFGSRTRTEAVSTVLLLEIVRLRAMIVELRAARDDSERDGSEPSPLLLAKVSPPQAPETQGSPRPCARRRADRRP